MESRTGRLNDLAAYASPAHRRFLRRRPGTPSAPDAELFPAVMLLADISGFSALTTALAARGPGGAEELSQILNDQFGRLVDLVARYGGEVLDFAGDAAIGYWSMADLPHAAARAAACAIAIRDALQGPVAAGMSLRVRVGVGAGEAVSALVGGSSGRWLTLVAGDARTEMLTAAAAAAAGDVVLAPSLVRLLGEGLEGDRLPDGCLRLHSMGTVPAANAGGPPAAFVAADTDDAALRTGVPRAVQKRIDAGQRNWLAEFTTVTTLFVNVPDLAYDDPARLESLQRVALAMQQTVHRFDGSVNRLMADDKGTVLIAVWGVPLHTHEDDPARAVLAALALRDDLQALGIHPAMGITTGRAFAGTVGNARRRQYALLGETINVAARLMQEARGDVLCDATTRAAAHERIRFGLLTPRRLKGRDATLDAGAALSPRQRTAAGDIVNRQAEQRRLADALSRLDERGEPGLLVITGEPGIGKSALVSVFLRRAQSSRIRVLQGASESIDRTAPYHAWRGVFDALLGVAADDGAEARLRTVVRVLGDDPAGRYLPLVSDVLGLGLPPSDATGNLSPTARAEAARELLTRIFTRARGDAPLALVLEDAHWMDSSSWSLAAALRRLPPHLLLILVLRPIAPGEMNDDGLRLLAEARPNTIDLDVLSGDEALALACRRLDVDALPEAVAVVIRERGEGHPLFTEQLVRALVERGIIRVEHHECHADPSLPIPDFPETVHGLVRGRIGLLAADEQLTLKIASVLGRGINLDALEAVHPFQRRPAIESQLAHMATLDLLEADAAESGVGYAFKHAIIREVAYGTLAIAQRRELHKAAAEWYEQSVADRAPAYALLARHWSEAGVFDKALAYLDLAGVQAFNTGNYRETLALMTEALAVGDRAPEQRTPLRHAVWLRRAGQACYALGRVGESRSYMERAAATLRRPLPASRPRRLVGIVAASARLWLRGLLGRARLDPAAPKGVEILEAATIVENAAYPYYLAGETLGLIYCLVMRVDLTDRLAPTAALVSATTGVAYVWGLVGFHRKADRLNAWALQTADALQSPRLRAFVLYSTAVLDIGRGQWSQAMAGSGESTSLYAGLGEHQLARDSWSLQLYVDTFRGDWARAREGYEQYLKEAVRDENLKHVGWACVGLAKLHYRLGDHGKALDVLGLGLSSASADPGAAVTELGLLTLRACVRARTGDFPGATADVEAVRARIDPKATPAALMQADGYGFLADACFQILRNEPAAGVRQGAVIACAALTRAARGFPAVQPTSLLWNGLLQETRGETARAGRTLRQALAGAERLSLVFERQRAAEEISRLSGTPAGR